ncbi:hypothetical protein PPACK8108_LOCUS13647 [Phakopsora pachyrhizi]|uniref:Uncharacterized protein n=1 Tax=Phakopsora pachyrhizi TaxID=170000 RepID=A0AAV0B622_PHAPC|nr:hypothetical protein PPACK8108_LOCUS13647 [Phakopsora pachyrhizi]
MTYKSNKTFPWLGHSTTGLQVKTQGGKSLGFIISMPITRHRSCSHNLTLIRFPYFSKDLGVSVAELGSKTDFPVSVSVSLLELLINIFGISLTSLTLNHLRKRGQGVEDERSERQRTDKDSRKFYNLEQIKIDKRRQNTKDVQEHTCPVEAIGQTMLNVSQNQSHFEFPIVQELTKPFVVDVALLNHVVSQDKGWTECPLVSESHYKHGMGAGFLTSVSVVLNTRSWFGLLVLVVWNILKNIVLSP